MSGKRRTFSREFKLAAVKKVVEQGLSCREVSQDLQVSDNQIRNWRKEFEADGTLPAESGDKASVEAELKRLREQNRQLKMERDILKKRRPSLPKKILEIEVHLQAPELLAGFGAVPRA